MKLTLLLEKGEWKLGSSGDIKKNESKAGELIFTCILVRKRKKKEGRLHFSARVGGGTCWHNARWNVGIRGLMNYY